MTNHYDIIVNLIDRALNEDIDLAELAQVHLNDTIEWHPLLSEALHTIEHFVADAHIRERDAEYDTIQKAELASYREKVSLAKHKFRGH